MSITSAQLHKIMPYAPQARLDVYAPLMNKNWPLFGIDTLAEQADWLAQVAHESSELRYTLEIASGQAYEGRKDLGNIHPGDGVRYKGRGLIQCTGLSNYLKMGKRLNLDLVNHPEILEQPDPAVQSACAFWQDKNLDQFALNGDFITETRRINGGTNGLVLRQAYRVVARKVLGLTP